MTEERAVENNSENTKKRSAAFSVELETSPGLKKINTDEKEAEDELQNTILDNLARLLEGNSVCAAVCLYDNDLFVTQNELSAGSGSKGGTGYEVIKEFIAYLKDPNQDEAERFKIFRDICRQKLSPMRFPGIINAREEKIFQKIVSETFNDTSYAWRLLNADKVIKKFFLGKCSNPDELATQILRTYQVFSRAAHDFRKIETKKKQLENVTLKIIQDDDTKGVHAELRIINYLFEKRNLLERLVENEPVYIGISKLCCEKCRHVIKALNLLSGKIIKNQDTEETKQYEIKILHEDEQATNKDRSEGKIIIQKQKYEGEEIVHIFDYHKNTFVDIKDLPDEYFLISEEISVSIETNKNDNAIDNLVSYLGCMKNIIRYADNSTRETHGLSAGEERWKCPPFMKKERSRQDQLYFFKLSAIEAESQITRKHVGGLVPKYFEMTPENIYAKFIEVEKAYETHLANIISEDEDFTFSDPAQSQSPQSRSGSIPNSPQITTTTVDQKITLAEVGKFIENNPDRIGEILGISYGLNLKDTLLKELENTSKELNRIQEDGLEVSKFTLETEMQTSFEKFGFNFIFDDSNIDNMEFIQQAKLILEEMPSCNFKDFNELINTTYARLKNNSNFSMNNY